MMIWIQMKFAVLKKWSFSTLSNKIYPSEKKIFTLQDYIFQVMLHAKQLSVILFPVSAYNQVSIFIEAYMTWATLV